jgi:hypothetical protein
MHQARKQIVIAEHALLPVGLSLFTNQQPAELQALQFFRIHTIPQLSGFFKFEIWTLYVLQISFSEPSLYHAVTALGGLHRWYVTRSTPESIGLKSFALQQYNKAIYHLLKPSRPLSDVTILATCYIFSCFEGLYGNHVAAFRHIASGIQMLSKKLGGFPSHLPEHINTVTEEEEVEIKLLYHFSRLDLLAATFDSAWKPREITEASLANFSLCFTTLEQSKIYLDIVMWKIMMAKRNELSHKDLHQDKIVPGTNCARKQLGQALTRWSLAHETWLSQAKDSSDPDQICGSRILKVQYLAATIMISVHEGANEIDYDQFLPTFSSIVTEASNLPLHPFSYATVPSQLYFSNDIGIIPALYLTGIKCRDPMIRRKAQTLLNSIRRKEGVWDSVQASQVVECVIAIEEVDRLVESCVDVPEEARVFDMGIEIVDNENGNEPVVVIFRGSRNRSRPEAVETRIYLK